MKRRISIGVVGCGTVGAEFIRAMARKRALLARRTGVSFRISSVFDADPARLRPWNALAASSAESIIRDPRIDIVVELIGGVETAYRHVTEALAAGKPVVTANKALLSERGGRIFSLAGRRGVPLGFEASVAAAIPVIKTLRESFIGNRITRLIGILNGTTNFILTRMTEEGMGFAQALRLAQARGYAEADPTLDITGMDAAHKLAILSRFAFNAAVPARFIPVSGIASLEPMDIAYAREFGYVVKLLAVGHRIGSRLDLRVHPALLSSSHLLTLVRDVHNAVYLEGDLIGKSLLYGEGAGGAAAASAGLSDVIEVGLQLRDGSFRPVGRVTEPGISQFPPQEVASQFYFRFMAADRPGVLARIARVLGDHDISIASVTQKSSSPRDAVPVVMLTHEARRIDVTRALRIINRFPVISAPTVAIAVEE